MKTPEIKTTNRAYLRFVKDDMFTPDMNPHSILIQVLPAMKEFYSIIALQAMAKTVPFKHSHEEWEQEFEEYADFYIKNLARVIYDYTVSAVFLELRHQSRSNLEIKFPASDGNSRQDTLNLMDEYSSISILKAGEFMFNPDNNDWASGYGGKAWYQISQAGLMYGKLPDMVFIDHCNDLSHNNGIYYDKEASILALNAYNPNETSLLGYMDGRKFFEEFLDFKRNAQDPRELLKVAQTFTLQKLIVKARILKIIKGVYKNAFKFEDSLVPYGISRYADLVTKNKFYEYTQVPNAKYGYWELDDMLRNYHPINFGTKEIDYTLFQRKHNFDEYGNTIREYRRRREA